MVVSEYFRSSSSEFHIYTVKCFLKIYLQPLQQMRGEGGGRGGGGSGGEEGEGF